MTDTQVQEMIADRGELVAVLRQHGLLMDKILEPPLWFQPLTTDTELPNAALDRSVDAD
jgi:hypothetical protein